MLGAHKSAKSTQQNCKIVNQKKIYISSFLLVFVYFVSHVCLRLHLSLIWKTKNLASSWHRRTQHQHRHHPAEALGHAERALRQQRQCQRVQSQPKISLQEPVPEFPLEAGHLQGRSIRRRRRYRKQTKNLCFYSLSHIIPKFSSNYGSVEPSLTVSLVHDLFVVSWTVSFPLFSANLNIVSSSANPP